MMNVACIITAAAMLFPLNAVSTDVQPQGGHQFPEITAAAYVKNSYAGNLRIAIDNKRYYSLEEPRPADQWLPQPIADVAYKEFGTRAVDKAEIQTCGERYSCSFKGVDAFMSIGSLNDAGSKPYVFVRLEVEVEPGKPKGRDIAVYRVELARVGSVWEARGATMEWRGH